MAGDERLTNTFPALTAGVYPLPCAATLLPACAGVAKPSPQLHALWAKTNPATGTRHPLLWHLLDAAAVADVLWERYASEAFHIRFTAAIGAESRQQSRAWFRWLAAMHDLGKVSPFFQCQGGPWAERADAAGMTCHDRVRDISHEALGSSLLWDQLTAWGADPRTATAWAGAVSIDHGYAALHDTIRHARAYTTFDGHPDLYLPVVAEAMSLVARTVGITSDCDWPIRPPIDVLNTAAGTIKAADWVASNPAMFPHTDQRLGALQYWAIAQHRARAAVAACGLVGWAQPTSSVPLTTQFGDGFVARPLQTVVIDAAHRLPLGSLIVVEAQMGEGKTEAALGAATEYAIKGATGLYVALPTQATARMMHDRVTSWLTRTDLSRRGAMLNTGDWAVPQPQVPAGVDRPDREDDDPTATTEPSRWFRGARRALLAKIGVGTVDQVLLSAQPVRYDIIRWAGLEGRVVVFDEVHAYDTFMSTLFERALRWLAALGCPVILLSATLPNDARRRFVNAYRSGLSGQTVDEPLPAVVYPAVTTATAERVDSIPVPGSRQTIRLHHVPAGDDPAATYANLLASRLNPHAHGSVAVVCNSVDRALATYRAVLDRFSDRDDVDVVLLHSRFVASDRAMHTSQVLTAAGKPGLQTRLERLTIVVATQIIEQSLDVDFDWMITEPAPVDLILQRSGRVHRWDCTPRQDWASVPTLTLVDAQPDADGHPNLASVSYVYQANAPATLLASVAALDGRLCLSYPDDIASLVNAVYDPELGCPNTVDPTRWADAVCEERRLEKQYRDQARQLTLPDPWLPAAWDAQQDPSRGKDDEDGYWFRSRAGDDSITVALARRLPDGRLQPVISDVPAALDGHIDLWHQNTLTMRKSPAVAGLSTPPEWTRGPMKGTRLLEIDAHVMYSSMEGLSWRDPPRG